MHGAVHWGCPLRAIFRACPKLTKGAPNAKKHKRRAFELLMHLGALQRVPGQSFQFTTDCHLVKDRLGSNLQGRAQTSLHLVSSSYRYFCGIGRL
jgi:hypothetical protein